MRLLVVFLIGGIYGAWRGFRKARNPLDALHQAAVYGIALTLAAIVVSTLAARV